MADRMADGMARLATRLKGRVGETVTYRRPSTGLSVTITASLGSQLLRTHDPFGGVKVERTDRDFIFTAADLVMGGTLTEPEAGDEIDVAFGVSPAQVTETYELCTVGEEAPWRYTDPFRTIIRAHGKLIETVTA